jgi:hypothetical protein
MNADDHLLGWYAASSGRSLPTFRRNVLPPFYPCCYLAGLAHSSTLKMEAVLSFRQTSIRLHWVTSQKIVLSIVTGVRTSDLSRDLVSHKNGWDCDTMRQLSWIIRNNFHGSRHPDIKYIIEKIGTSNWYKCRIYWGSYNVNNVNAQ